MRGYEHKNIKQRRKLQYGCWHTLWSSFIFYTHLFLFCLLYKELTLTVLFISLCNSFIYYIMKTMISELIFIKRILSSLNPFVWILSCLLILYTALLISPLLRPLTHFNISIRWPLTRLTLQLSSDCRFSFLSLTSHGRFLMLYLYNTLIIYL